MDYIQCEICLRKMSDKEMKIIDDKISNSFYKREMKKLHDLLNLTEIADEAERKYKEKRSNC